MSKHKIVTTERLLTSQVPGYCGAYFIFIHKQSVPSWSVLPHNFEWIIPNKAVIADLKTLDRILWRGSGKCKMVTVGSTCFILPEEILLPFDKEEDLLFPTDLFSQPEGLAKIRDTAIHQFHNFGLEDTFDTDDGDMPEDEHEEIAYTLTGNRSLACCLSVGNRYYTDAHQLTYTSTWNTRVALSVPHGTEEERNSWQHNGYYWVNNALGYFVNPAHANENGGSSIGTLMYGGKRPPKITVQEEVNLQTWRKNT